MVVAVKNSAAVDDTLEGAEKGDGLPKGGAAYTIFINGHLAILKKNKMSAAKDKN